MAHLLAGVDIGATKIAVCLADKHQLLGKLQAPVAKAGASSAIGDQAWQMIAQLLTQQGAASGDLIAIGIASCGPFVRLSDGSRALAAPNLCGGLAGNPYKLPNDWALIPVQQVLLSHCQTVVIENDCVAALQAERVWGAVRGIDDCIYATWSTGIGFGLCVDGKLLAGKQGNAGHAGHISVEMDAQTECGCGNKGDIESQLSGKALERRWGMAPAEMFAKARAGEAAALAEVDWAVERFAAAFYSLLVVLDTQRIVIGGSVFNHNQDLLLPRLNKALCAPPRSGLVSLSAGVDIVPAQLGDKVTDWGGLSLVKPADWALAP